VRVIRGALNIVRTRLKDALQIASQIATINMALSHFAISIGEFLPDRQRLAQVWALSVTLSIVTLAALQFKDVRPDRRHLP
jgi:hypothetical protein